MRKLTAPLLLTLFSSLSAAAEQAPCAGERVTVLPLFPVATSPGVANCGRSIGSRMSERRPSSMAA